MNSKGIIRFLASGVMKICSWLSLLLLLCKMEADLVKKGVQCGCFFN